MRDGAADRGEMARVDVFRKQNKHGAWQYFLVPIYPHQVFDATDWPGPPMQAIQAAKPETEWPNMRDGYEFMWSAYSLSFLELEKADGTFIDGYFRGVHRATSALTISPHYSKDEIVEGIGPRSLKSLRKYAIDRLGNRSEIVQEKRTWRGAVCT